MIINIPDHILQGDMKASSLFLVKYTNISEPENAGHELFIASDAQHLESLLREHLRLMHEVGEWKSIDYDSGDLNSFEEEFENDWGNWIKAFEIGFVQHTTTPS
jgi:hypothetical protein